VSQEIGHAAQPQSAIEFDSIAKRFWAKGETVHAIQHVDLTVRRGEFICLVGPSGCGKSTLLRLVAGLETPSAGSVTINRGDRRRPALAVAFQDYSIFPWKTVLGNVMFGLRMLGLPRAECEQCANDMIGRMGLRGFERAYPRSLSGGMKQRVALARALAIDPEILLLDEPFAALDAQMRHLLQDQMLRQWDASQDRTAILVTHSLEEAILLGDRIVLMSRRPSLVKRDVAVPFARPRDPALRNSAAFGELRQMLWRDLEEEVLATLAASEQAA
jgi:NitT/TauT family transport system ATP-binding protein